MSGSSRPYDERVLKKEILHIICKKEYKENI